MKKSITLLISLVLLIGCHTENDPTPEPKPEPTPTPVIPPAPIITLEEQELINVGNTFAFNFFKVVNTNKENQGINTLISPLSASLAFSMLNNGASGETLEQLQRALGIEGTSPEEINKLYKKIVKDISSANSDTKIEIANSIWIQNDFPVLEPFIQTNKESYDTEIKNVELQSTAALKEINQWVSDHTQGCIPEMFEKELSTDIMLLLNTVYFKAQWDEPFTKEATTQELFTNADGSQSGVAMMQKGEHYYAENEFFAATKLAYYKNAFEMVFLLPHKDVSMTDALESLTTESWDKLINTYSEQSYIVRLKLPRFHVEYECDLKPVLQQLGVQAAFDTGKAEFPGISDFPTYVEKTFQKTFINLNEDGTEVAGSTAIEMGPGASGPPKIVDFYMDRPFLYLIHERRTGTILFMGKIEQM